MEQKCRMRTTKPEKQWKKYLAPGYTIGVQEDDSRLRVEYRMDPESPEDSNSLSLSLELALQTVGMELHLCH